MDLLHHGRLSSRGGLRGSGLRLAGRPHRPRPCHGPQHLRLFNVHRGLLFVAHAWQLVGLQFLAATGMGGEWALGVAIVVECWPDRLRPMLSGAIGSAANCGLLLIGLLAMISGHARPLALGRCHLFDAGLAGLFHRGLPARIERWQESARCASARSAAQIFGTRLLRFVLLGIALLCGADRHLGVRYGLLALVGRPTGRAADPFAKGKTMAVMSLGAIVGSLFGPSSPARRGGGSPTSACASARWSSANFFSAACTLTVGRFC